MKKIIIIGVVVLLIMKACTAIFKSSATSAIEGYYISCHEELSVESRVKGGESAESMKSEMADCIWGKFPNTDKKIINEDEFRKSIVVVPKI